MLWSFYDYLVEKQDELWVAPFCEVAAYTKEAANTHLTIEEQPGCLVVTPHTSLDSTLFCHPLTLVVKAPIASAEQDGQQLGLRTPSPQNSRTYDLRTSRPQVSKTSEATTTFVDFSPHKGPVNLVLWK